MKSWLSTEYIQRLNAVHSGGVFLQAAVLELDDMTTYYVVNAHDPITFDGNTYTPRGMQWQGLTLTSGPELLRMTVTVSDVDGAVSDLLETTQVRGRPVLLQLLHEDLLGTVTDLDQFRLAVLQPRWDDVKADFIVGLDLGLEQQFPRHVITRAEFPGTPDTVRRASIL